MLIRNLTINDGLCNGTRMKIIGLFKFNIKVEIISGTHAGNCLFIPRIMLDTGEILTLLFILYRRKFPIVLAFAITINKSQGQSLEKVGICFRRPLFSHGQLYVALSRCKDASHLFIENDSEGCDEITNVVWTGVFDCSLTTVHEC